VTLTPEAGSIPAMTAVALAEAYRGGRLTPIAVLEAILDRHDAVNPMINAVIHLDRDGARAAARAANERWRSGAPLSPLDGVPFTVKDNLFVAGQPATWGSRLYEGFIPDHHEPAVGRLIDAGLVVIGKTNVPEFTLQGYTDNLLFGPTRNPLAPDRTPGGSTGGGAAAVAAGIGPIAIGTDGGGSTRRPAAYCGLYGLKPSLGAMARWGGFPQILSDFEVVGPIARSAGDVAAAFAIMRGYDPRDPRSAASLGASPSRGRRIGFVPGVGDAPVDPAIAATAASTAEAFAGLGFIVETVPAPYDAAELAELWTIIAESGLAWLLRSFADWAGAVGENALRMEDAGRRHTALDYADALARIGRMRVAAGEFFGRYDFMLSPTTAALAWPAREAFPTKIADRAVGPRGHAIFSAWVNLIGGVAANFPAAITKSEGGIGMQLAAPAGHDDAVISVLCRWEAARSIEIEAKETVA